jgi:hypothetical protein
MELIGSEYFVTYPPNRFPESFAAATPFIRTFKFYDLYGKKSKMYVNVSNVSYIYPLYYNHVPNLQFHLGRHQIGQLAVKTNRDVYLQGIYTHTLVARVADDSNNI